MPYGTLERMRRTDPKARLDEWVLDDAAAPAVTAVAHRASLMVLRPSLHDVEIDPTDAGWPPEAQSAVQALRAVGAEQGCWPAPRRIFARTGVDLNPASDKHFEILSELSPHTLLADGWDHARHHVYSASDSGGLWLRLSRVQHEQLTQRLHTNGIDPGILIPRR